MIKITKFIIALTLLISFNAIIIAQNMGSPFLIKSGDEIIDCKPPYTDPVCIDYDGDALQDLIVGTFLEVNSGFIKILAQMKN